MNAEILEKQLIENYDNNRQKYLSATGIKENDRRFQSAVFAHRWELIKCREYAKLLEEIKEEIGQGNNK